MPGKIQAPRCVFGLQLYYKVKNKKNLTLLG